MTTRSVRRDRRSIREIVEKGSAWVDALGKRRSPETTTGDCPWIHDVCPRGGRRLISDNEITFRSGIGLRSRPNIAKSFLIRHVWSLGKYISVDHRRDTCICPVETYSRLLSTTDYITIDSKTSYPRSATTRILPIDCSKDPTCPAQIAQIS